MGAAYSFHLALHEYFSAPGSNLGCRQDGDACALARARGKANAAEYVGSTACGQTDCTGHGVEAWACYHKGSQPSPATGRGWVDLGKLVTHLKSHTRHEKKRVCIGDLVKTKGIGPDSRSLQCLSSLPFLCELVPTAHTEHTCM